MSSDTLEVAFSDDGTNAPVKVEIDPPASGSFSSRLSPCQTSEYEPNSCLTYFTKLDSEAWDYNVIVTVPDDSDIVRITGEVGDYVSMVQGTRCY